MGKIALVEAGILGVLSKHALRGRPYDDMLAPCFDEQDVPLDGVLLDEHWDPGAVFSGWAVQIANALHKEDPVVWPPWVAPEAD